MESKAPIKSAVDSILKQLSYTEQSSDPKRVVANLQFDPKKKDECDARWHLVNTLSHELLHVMVHEDFRGKAAGRQIMVEGFTEVLGDTLYDRIASKARKDKAHQATFEAGVSGAPCIGIPFSSTGYGAAGKNAEKLRGIVGDDRFRAAYFLGRIDLLGVAPKREHGGAGDTLEREAAAAEARAGERNAPNPFVAPATAAAPVHPALRALTVEPLGDGRRLDESTRVSMESSLGYDFRHVRIHDDSRASESARGVNARAYTVGSHIVFGGGRYAPGTDAGQRLLVHELTHVAQQSSLSTPVLQRAPDRQGTGAYDLPWSGKGHSLFEVTSSGIRVLVAVVDSREAAIRGKIPPVAKRIASDNKLISDGVHQVKTCIIAPTTTRFAHFDGNPVLMLSADDVNEETAAHEMGHALFDFYKARAVESGAEEVPAGDVRLFIADIYSRLASSTQKKITIGGTEHEHAVGYWMVNPSQWQPGGKPEHPWDDPDEFFASAKAAYQINRRGLEKAIQRATKIDPAVKKPAQDLIDLLDDLLSSSKLPTRTVPAARTSAARKELGRVGRPSDVETTLTQRADEPLGWLLEPRNRPEPEEVGPAAGVGSGVERERSKHRNLVTGEGGVIEKMEKRFEERLRQKVLDSVNELP